MEIKTPAIKKFNKLKIGEKGNNAKHDKNKPQ